MSPEDNFKVSVAGAFFDLLSKALDAQYTRSILMVLPCKSFM